MANEIIPIIILYPKKKLSELSRFLNRSITQTMKLPKEGKPVTPNQ
jgi:hypothetical protein